MLPSKSVGIGPSAAIRASLVRRVLMNGRFIVGYLICRCGICAEDHGKRGRERVAVLPDRQDEPLLDFVVHDTANRMADVGKFAVTIVEHTLMPSMVLEMRKPIDESCCSIVRGNQWQENIDTKASHEMVGEGGILHRDEAVVTPAPEARVKSCGDCQVRHIAAGDHPSNADRTVVKPDVRRIAHGCDSRRS